MDINWNFDNSYARLPSSFKENIKPVIVKKPELLLLNEKLADDLDLDFSNIERKKLAELFAGNVLPNGSDTIAQAYAGHQFGHFTMLGDGRAVLIGEHINKKQERYDIQFKGSGRTSFSRNGDGRAVLGPMLREYLISEAINALNIPTTRSLAVVKTGEQVVRENLLPGAILTRVASSHLRVGTFQYVAARQNKDELKILFDYVVNRHYPEIIGSKNRPIELFKIVLDKQINLVIDWMRIGFIHGVMNTDNMSISGETIDYGPCAFMDIYDPKTVFSSIDKMGRYAYCNQPMITKWNLARFAECLIPLIDSDQNKAINLATKEINSFDNKYEEKWLKMMGNKLGLSVIKDQDKSLILDLLTWMHQKKADYTNTFCYLMDEEVQKKKIYDDNNFITWKKRWKERLKKSDKSSINYLRLMKKFNPIVIPRNNKVEEALRAAEENNIDPFNKLLKILKNPYVNQKEIKEYQIPSNTNENYQTFCGT